jgi:hypothetical protein
MKKILLIAGLIFLTSCGESDSDASSNSQTYSSNGYVLSTFKNKEFQGLSQTFTSKSECMRVRRELWVENRDNGWTYGCRKR